MQDFLIGFCCGVKGNDMGWWFDVVLWVVYSLCAVQPSANGSWFVLSSV